MRTANRVKSEGFFSLYSLLHNNWSVPFEITMTMLLNDDPTCIPPRSERTTSHLWDESLERMCKHHTLGGLIE